MGEAAPSAGLLENDNLSSIASLVLSLLDDLLQCTPPDARVEEEPAGLES